MYQLIYYKHSIYTELKHSDGKRFRQKWVQLNKIVVQYSLLVNIKTQVI